MIKLNRDEDERHGRWKQSITFLSEPRRTHQRLSTIVRIHQNRKAHESINRPAPKLLSRRHQKRPSAKKSHPPLEAGKPTKGEAAAKKLGAADRATATQRPLHSLQPVAQSHF